MYGSIASDNNHSRHRRGQQRTPSVWWSPFLGLPFDACAPVEIKIRRRWDAWKTSVPHDGSRRGVSEAVRPPPYGYETDPHGFSLQEGSVLSTVGSP